MEAAMKQTVANKQQLQKEYQRLEFEYNSNKVHNYVNGHWYT